MAFRLPGLFAHSLRTPLFIGGAVGFSTCIASPLLQHRRAIQLDASPASSATSPKDWSLNQYQRDARAPVVQSGRLNARAVRQLSAGSIIGLVAGLGVSIFSKSLVLLVGLLIAGVQTAEHYGIHLVPYKTIQRYAKGVDVRSALQDNVAFKVSFGLMFALSAFAELPS